MLIDEDGFDLGMPTREETLEHQVLLLTHEESKPGCTSLRRTETYSS